MKRIYAMTACMVILLSLVSCGAKTRPSIKLDTDAINSFGFKKTVFYTDLPDKRDYTEKTVTERADIDSIASWLQSLRLSKHEAIEIRLENVKYVISFGEVKRHTIIFVDDYIVYDTTAYTFDIDSQKDDVAEKYNLLNYEETDTELALM